MSDSTNRDSTKTNQHTWLISKLSSAKYTLEELEKAWEQEHNYSRNKRTIQRWIHDVEMLHNVFIVCYNKKYFIADKGNFKKYDTKYDKKYDTERWIAYTTKINDLFTQHDDIQDKILIDNIPSENQNLEDILNAISNHLTIKISYTKYSSDDSRNLENKKYTLHPYCVKRFENRWYVTGLVVKKGVKNAEKVYHQIQTFSLDMIKKLELQKKTFKPDPNFNAANYFKDVYGIITNQKNQQDNLVEIRIRTNARRANYLYNLPLHPSQEEFSQSASFSVFHYKLKPARDFYQALLHFGPDVEVLSPESVRNEMKELIQEMAEKYK